MRREADRLTGMRRALRIVGGVCAVGALAGAAGCSSGGTHTAGTSVASSSAAPATSTLASNSAWNPCSIPDADIAAAGLNPATKDVGSGGVRFPGWDICSWDSDSWYGIEVYSTNAHTFDEAVHNTTNFRNPRTATVGGRSATMLDPLNIPQGCTLIFDATSGPVEIDLDPKLSAQGTGTVGNSCAELTRIAGSLLKDLPANK
jgi:uncharacterized protein YceK